MSLNKRTVTLEDLLKVKRAERPPAEFWAEFDREMRVKQLAAIVEPRPWWAPFIRVGARVSRYQLPMGAAAILALSLVTVREYRTVGGNSAAEAAIPVEASRLPAPEIAASRLAPSELPAPAAVELAALEITPSEDPAVQPAPTGQTSHTIQVAEAVPAVAEPSPSARYIAANLAAVQADNPALVEEAFGVTSLRAEPRGRARDPLAEISSRRESRRSRLLATALPASATSNEVAVGSSYRVSRQLTEERLYDSISRVGVQGDRVAFKF